VGRLTNDPHDITVRGGDKKGKRIGTRRCFEPRGGKRDRMRGKSKPKKKPRLAVVANRRKKVERGLAK